jgi:hypothetical protein
MLCKRLSTKRKRKKPAAPYFFKVLLVFVSLTASRDVLLFLPLYASRGSSGGVC